LLGFFRVRRCLALPGIQTHGDRSKSLSADVLLGVVFGLDNVLWACAFASRIFVSALSVYLPLGIAIPLVSGAIVAAGPRRPDRLIGLSLSQTGHRRPLRRRVIMPAAALVAGERRCASLLHS
jgi:hypothetical protein